MKEIILEAKYPILNSNDFFTITIQKPAVDEVPGGDYICSCELSAPGYIDQLSVHGIDPIQSVWIALGHIRTKIKEFEGVSQMKLEYTYSFPAFEE